MDNGFPFTTEPNILREIIPPPSLLGAVSTLVSLSVFVESVKVCDR